MKDKKKGGFTLIEAVVCIAILGILSVAFVQLAGGSLKIFTAGNEYDSKTAELVSAAQNKTLGDGMVKTVEPDMLRLNLCNGCTLSLDRVTLSEEGGSVDYYAYEEG